MAGTLLLFVRRSGPRADRVVELVSARHTFPYSNVMCLTLVLRRAAHGVLRLLQSLLRWERVEVYLLAR